MRGINPLRPGLGVVLWCVVLLSMADAKANNDRLRVGAVRYIGEAHNFIADEQGLFERNGIEVELVIADAGVQSLRRLFAGEVEIATVAPTPVVFAALNPNFPLGRAAPDFVILANLLQSSRLNYVVALDGRGIESPRDLEGKTVALTMGTASEYLWYSFALYHGIDTAKVRLVHSRMGDMLETLRSGKPDAFIAWEPNVQDIRDSLGDVTKVMPGTQFYVTGWMVLARRAFVSDNAGLIERYLRALHGVERFLRENSRAAIRIHARRIGMAENSVGRLYPKITFNMTLDEALILNLEAQAKWAAQAKFSSKRVLPDFRRLIFEKPLQLVKPTGINFLR